MTKTFCDCCERETKKIYKFEYLKHIEVENKLWGYAEIIEGIEKNICAEPISGIKASKDLCLQCYNKIFISAYNEFCEISKNKIKEKLI